MKRASKVSYYHAPFEPRWRETFSETTELAAKALLLILPIALLLAVSFDLTPQEFAILGHIMAAIILATFAACWIFTAMWIVWEKGDAKRLALSQNKDLEVALTALERGEHVLFERHVTDLIDYCRTAHPEKPWARLLEQNQLNRSQDSADNTTARRYANPSIPYGKELTP